MKKLLFFAIAACAHAVPPPVVYYINIASGPNSGGRNNNGTTACVVGNYFGSSRGSSTITIGGAAVAEYITWGDYTVAGATQSRACFSVGASVTGGPGNVIVTVNGIQSPVTSRATFTVRSASIFYAGVTTDIGGSPGTASNSNNGSFNTPVASIRKCKDKVVASAGSICYARSSAPNSILPEPVVEAFGTNLYLNGIGTTSAPLTLSGWPADAGLPVIGDYASSAVYSYGVDIHLHDHWTFTGFWLKGSSVALKLNFEQTDFRVTDNYMECPHGNGSTGCFFVIFNQNNPPQDQTYYFYNNEITNVGCGFGKTGDLDDSATLSGQALTFPCTTGSNFTSTMSSSNGILLTRTGGSAINVSGVEIGDHIFVATTTPGVYEERIISVVTTTQVTVTVAFTTTTFSGAAWHVQKHISDKLYHVTYFGTDTNGYDVGWHYIHNNSANHGLNIHSTAASAPASAGISLVTAGTPATVTLLSSMGTGAPVDGQRVDLVTLADNHNNMTASAGGFTLTVVSGGAIPDYANYTAGMHICVDSNSDGTFEDATVATASSTVFTLSAQSFTTTTFTGKDWKACSVPQGSYYAKRIDDLHFQLYSDVALTTPVTAASNGAGGAASRSGFGMFNFSAHDNFVTYQNGACFSLANADPDRGPISVYNNQFTYCGTGPWLGGGRPNNMGAFYFLNTPDNVSTIAWGTGTTEVYNNTIYNAGVYNAGDFMLGINMAKPGWLQFFNFRNNIFYQPSGLAFAAATSDGFEANILGNTNIFYGTNSASIPTQATSNVTADPMFVSFTDFHIQSASPARNNGLTIPTNTWDILGLTRPQGSGFCIGAYEYETPPAVGDPTSVISPSLLGGNAVVH